MEKEEIKKEAVKIVRKYLPREYKIFLFGSWAKGDALETSDLDIGILGEKEVPWELMHKILEDIEEIPTLRSIDIVDLKSTGENYTNKILEYAKPLP